MTVGEFDRGAVVWLTGLPSSGKTTVASRLADRLRARKVRVALLDGDELRRSLNSDLGFSREDRLENVRRIGVVANLLARNGIVVLVPVIAPDAAGRAGVRALQVESGLVFIEVHVATPVEVCAARDVKGLYAEQRAGRLSGLTGVDAPYDVPEHPEIRLRTEEQTVAESVDELYAALRRHWPVLDADALTSSR